MKISSNSPAASPKTPQPIMMMQQQPVLYSSPMEFKGDIASQWFAGKSVFLVEEINKIFKFAEKGLLSIDDKKFKVFINNIKTTRSELCFGHFFKLVENISRIAFFVFTATLAVSLAFFSIVINKKLAHVIAGSVFTIINVSLLVISAINFKVCGFIGDKMINYSVHNKMKKAHPEEMKNTQVFSDQFPKAEVMLKLFRDAIAENCVRQEDKSMALDDLLEMDKLVSKYQDILILQKARHQFIMKHLQGSSVIN